MSGANTLFNIAQQMPMGVGVAFGAVALRITSPLYPGAAGLFPLGCFHIAFVNVGATALIGLLDALSLHPSCSGGKSANGDDLRVYTTFCEIGAKKLTFDNIARSTIPAERPGSSALERRP